MARAGNYRIVAAPSVRHARLRGKGQRLADGNRQGLATVELAVCLPVLALILFGSIQATDLIFLKHAVTSASYEGCLELSRPNATNASVEARVAQVLQARGISSTRVRILPAGRRVENAKLGQLLKVEVTAEVGPNLMIDGFFITPNEVSCQLTAAK